MLAVQPLSRGERIELLPGNDVGKKFHAQAIRAGPERSHGVEAPLRRRQNRFALLMEQRGKKQKFRMLDLEAAALFADAALAQDDDLLSAPQRIHDDGPFFKCRSHNSI